VIVHVMVWGVSGSDATHVKDNDKYFLFQNNNRMRGGIADDTTMQNHRESVEVEVSKRRGFPVQGGSLAALPMLDIRSFILSGMRRS
jgi:hypothetical protein